MEDKEFAESSRHPALLSRRDVATRFGVAPETVTRWAKEGTIPYVQTLGGQRRYPADEVERLLLEVWEHSRRAESPRALQHDREEIPQKAE